MFTNIHHSLTSCKHSARDTKHWKSSQKIAVSPILSFCSASLLYLQASWLLIIFSDHRSCLLPVYPLLWTHTFSYSSVIFIPISCYLVVLSAKSSQTCQSQNLFTLKNYWESQRNVLWWAISAYIHCMTNWNRETYNTIKHKHICH